MYTRDNAIFQGAVATPVMGQVHTATISEVIGGGTGVCGGGGWGGGGVMVVGYNKNDHNCMQTLVQ